MSISHNLVALFEVLVYKQDGRIPGPEVSNVGGEDAVALKMEKIRLEIEQLQRQRREVHANIASGANNNAALLQRFRQIKVIWKVQNKM